MSVIDSNTPMTRPDYQLSITEAGKVVNGYDHLSQLIRILLLTEPGSDVMRPDFGIGVLGLVDTPIQNVSAELRKRGRQQFRDYLPEIRINSYVAEYDDAHDGKLTITVNWSPVNTLTEFTTTITA